MIEYVNAIGHWWWSWTAAMFWQVSLLIVVIGCIDLLVRRWAWPQLRYALWSLVLIKLLLPPMLSLPTGLAPRLVPWVAQISRSVAVARQAGQSKAMDKEGRWAEAHPTAHPTAFSTVIPDGLTSDDRLGMEAVDLTASPVVVDRRPVDAGAIQAAGPRLDWQVYAMGLGLLGAVVMSTFLAVRLYSLSRGASHASDEVPVPQSFYNQMHRCASRLGLRRLPRVASTQRLSSPAVFGLVRPVLLMPVGYLSRLSRRDTEHMLLHELAHIKRGDLWMHGLTLLLQIVYWYNPLLWLVRRQVRHLRELCCDATVAGLLREETPAYRQTLLDMARRFLAVRSEPGLGLLGLFEDSNLLLTRLNSLEKPHWRYRRMKRTIVITLIGLMLACVLPMAQAQDTVASKSSDNAAAQKAADQLQKEMDQLRQQMEQLQEQMQQLARKMAETSTKHVDLVRHQVAGIPGMPTVPHVPQVNISIPDMPHLPADLEHHTDNMDANKVEATVEGEYTVKSVKPDTILEIQNNVGSITIQGSDQSVCTVKTIIKAKAATKEQAEEMARKVQIQVTPTDDVVRIGAEIPEELRNNKDGEGIQVTFELTVPRQVRVQAAQQVGHIRLVSLDGDVEAKTNVGNIQASGLKAGASLKTNVGNIDLSIPAGASAKVNARTQVGAITSDLPLDMTGTAVLKGALGSSATGVLGDGQHKIDLQSQVGVIKIRSESSTVSHQF